MTARNRGTEGRAGRLAIALVAAAVLLRAPLAAQEGGSAGPRPVTFAPTVHLPSSTTATALAAAGTLVGFVGPALAHDAGWGTLASWCIGPSLGFLYGGCWLRGLSTTALRFGLTLAFAAAAMNDDNYGAWGTAWICGMAGTAILDIATTGRAVRHRNRIRMLKRGFALDVAPVVVRQGAGVSLRVSF